MEEKINSNNLMKKLVKSRRFRVVIIFAVCCSLYDPNTSTTQTQIQQTDHVQERINRINDVFTEDQAFEKAEKIEKNVIWIFFTSAPSESIETITRWQAMNLSNDINGVASVKLFVWWKAQMFCTATKWEVKDCIDYR